MENWNENTQEEPEELKTAKTSRLLPIPFSQRQRGKSTAPPHDKATDRNEAQRQGPNQPPMTRSLCFSIHVCILRQKQTEAGAG